MASWRHTADACPASSGCIRVFEGTAIVPTVGLRGAGLEAGAGKWAASDLRRAASASDTVSIRPSTWVQIEHP